MRNFLLFILSFFFAPLVLADVRGVFESSVHPVELHVFFKDENHFKLEFVPKGSSEAENYLTVGDDKAFFVSDRGDQAFASDFSNRLRTVAECAGRVEFASQEETEVVAGLEGEVVTVTVDDNQLSDGMVLSRNELAGKLTNGYFLALSVLANDGREKPSSFIDPLVLFACIRDAGYSALLSENSRSRLRDIVEIELPTDFYSLPPDVRVMTSP